MADGVSLGQFFNNAVSKKPQVGANKVSYTYSNPTNFKDELAKTANQFLADAGDGKSVSKGQFFDYVKGFGSDIDDKKLEKLYKRMDLDGKDGVTTDELQAMLATIDNLDGNKESNGQLDGQINSGIASRFLENTGLKELVSKWHGALFE